MDSELKLLQRQLRKRQLELQQLIHQMKSDRLNESPVYKNLEHELSSIEDKLRRRSENA